MPQMTFIREVNPYSFLVLTTAGEGFCLRDFSAKVGPVIEVARQSPGRGTTEIRELGRRNGNHLIDVPERRIDDYDYWHEQTVAINSRLLIPPLPPPEPRWRWLAEHSAKVVAGVLIAVLAAAALTWLGLNK